MSMILYEEIKETTDHKTGEVQTSKKFTSVKHDNEPSYIKLYLNDICKLNDIPKTGNDVLNELLQLVNYDNEIVLSSGIKNRIVKQLGIKKGSLDNNIYKLTKQGILSRIDRGIYMLNPLLFGKGKWPEIKALRITWEYTSTGREQIKLETDTHIQTKIDFDDEVA